MKNICVVWITLGLAFPAFAQTDLTRMLSGIVTAQGSQIKLSGVLVSIKGTSFGTYSDANGQYRIKLSPNEQKLVFSAAGYISEEVNVDAHQVMDISLIPDPQSLPELKVTGYIVPKYSRHFKKSLRKRQRQAATDSEGDSSALDK